MGDGRVAGEDAAQIGLLIAWILTQLRNFPESRDKTRSGRLIEPRGDNHRRSLSCVVENETVVCRDTARLPGISSKPEVRNGYSPHTLGWTFGDEALHLVGDILRPLGIRLG